jgi:hypothetical protein
VVVRRSLSVPPTETGENLAPVLRRQTEQKVHEE